MELDDFARTHQLVRMNEGFRSKPYRDSVGILTIGCGRNLESRGISSLEADVMLNNDIHGALLFLSNYSFFATLAPARQAALADMVINLGAQSFSHFTEMLQHLSNGAWLPAACAMLNSKWAAQVGERAKRDAQMMETGEWPK